MVSPGIRILAIIVAMCIVQPTEGQTLAVLQEGDLLFCCSDTANAITEVTRGVEDLPIDHVAVFHRIGGENGLPCVIEAVKPSVRITPFDTFCQENPRLLLGRVNVPVDIKASVRRCLMMVDRPYDDLYLPGDSAIYCSELVQLNYVNSQGDLIFEPVPMSFHDATGQVTGYWRQFYAERGMTVPEGEPGSNPGELSRRSQVSILAIRPMSAGADVKAGSDAANQ